MKMKQLTDVKPLANREHNKCAFCRQARGVIPVFDEQNTEYWICETCDQKMDWQ